MLEHHPQRSTAVELSVVIAAYNAVETLRPQLDALLAQEWAAPWELIVADNGSTDGTAALVQRTAEMDNRVHLVDASDRRGPAHARNCGVAAARGTSIVFCDADDVVGRGWLAAVGVALRNFEFVTGPQEYERLNPPWLHGVYGTVPARELQTFAGVFPFGPAANLGVRRALFERVGGFDPALDAGEDVDLSMKIWLAGEHLTFEPEAVVHYRYRQTNRDLWRQAVRYGAARPALARRLADAGRPMPSRLRGVRNWFWLVRHAPNLCTRAGKARWLVVAGGSVGRLKGSARARYVVL